MVPATEAGAPSAAGFELEAGLADVLTLDRRRAAGGGDEQAMFLDTVAEYQWARDVAGLAPSTLERLVGPVLEVCEHFEVVPWRLTARDVDRYFAGPGRRSTSTVRRKLNAIDGYFVFLEQRYAGELARRFDVRVESPVDRFNRPRHRGDFGLRVPPSRRAMREFFASWRAWLPQARKPLVACRDYVMAKIAYVSGVRAAELCAVRLADVHWEAGQWGRFVVQGKGARGSGPRQRMAYLFADGRSLLWWYVEEVRGLFPDDVEHPDAPLWPSERLSPVAASLGIDGPGLALAPGTFGRALKAAGERFLPPPGGALFPHLLRHACATHNYEAGMSLWEVQKLLGHEWTTTTVRYLATAHADPEQAALAASDRAVQRLQGNTGRLQ
ncbi:hypothetical protein GCM10010532_097960 [Dactylosporangium siamense]|uniref:Tyr recombinase domain-containing protein n=1 Tax=Dactylosporangium siamense TaxID=685454 RepID=A0A919Q1H2_9ACTN|nr:hypothetical protein Dsi01nite_112070 [Dactylosporangium siamense]